MGKQPYIPSYGFEQLDTYTDSHSLFEGLWEEWFNLNLFLTAREMQRGDVFDEEILDILPKEKQSELIGKKADFANKTGITP